MDQLTKILADYARQVALLATSPETTEATFYPALQSLLNGLLRGTRLPFEVRTNTAQRRAAGGADQPDLAFYDGANDAVVVLGEVKTPGEDLEVLARSTAQNDQIGRYLAQTGVVLLSNVRSFGLLTRDPQFQGVGPVPPAHRRLEEVVEIWPSASALSKGRPATAGSEARLCELLDTAVTEFATIAQPESLARILARLARRAKDGLPDRFSQAVQPLLDDFAKALGIQFEEGEGEQFLRSSLIQTAFYGLFAAWALWRHSGARRPFRWEDLGEYLKIPFLGELFHEFRHPQRLRELGLAEHLDRATAALHRVDGDRFFTRFVVADLRVGRQAAAAPATGAILYFYEPFLEAFDPELRKKLGVWYTPQEIVRYQVRKVDRLLREELGCERGFADDRVVVLDPCCGTGAYLIEVLRCIAEQLEEEGSEALLGSKLLEALCNRIVGFEVLTAPFVIAQLQVFLILASLGIEPDAKHRPAIFLTNALTGWEGPEQLRLLFPELQEEYDAARRVKHEAKIIVILGNPPYDRYAGIPVQEEADLVDPYKGLQRNARGKQLGKTGLYAKYGIRKQLLDDLYIRFFRLAEVRIGEHAEYGIVSWISNSSYLAGRSHPIMRESLLRRFHSIWIDNLHGNRLASERTPWGQSCETIFSTEEVGPGIKVGTCITTLLKRRTVRGGTETARVLVRDFWGRSHLKRQALLTSLELDGLPKKEKRRLAGLPEGPREYERVTPSAQTRWKLVPYRTLGGYEDWPALDEIFSLGFMGVHTGKDAGVTAFSRQELLERFSAYFDRRVSHADMAALAPSLMTPANEFIDPETFRASMQADFEADDPATKSRSYLYRPLDDRWIWYDTRRRVFARPDKPWSGCLVQRYGEEFENALLDDNVFLCAVSQPRRRSESRPLLAHGLVDLHVSDRGVTCFPAEARAAAPSANGSIFSAGNSFEPAAWSNLDRSVWHALQKAWSLSGDLAGEDAKSLVRRLFSLVLAVAHAPQFEEDHHNALSQDWLHLPIPKDPSVFLEAAGLGDRLARLLDPLVDAGKPMKELLGTARRTLGVVQHREHSVVREADLVVTISFFGAAQGGWRERAPGKGEAANAAWGASTGDLWLNDAVFLKNVPERVWRYELGGYPVIKKWLGYRDVKRRPGRGLTLAELERLREIIHRVAAVHVLHAQLDAAYEKAIADPFTSEDLGLG